MEPLVAMPFAHRSVATADGQRDQPTGKRRHQAAVGSRPSRFLDPGGTNELERRGHQVLSVTNSFGPNDCGIDIGTLRQGIQWTVRIKEKPPDAKVQEPEVEAFADSLPSDRLSTGAIMVTNTGYTKAAEALAKKLGIHALRGERPAFPP
jgi:Restriction endonuclease